MKSESIFFYLLAAITLSYSLYRASKTNFTILQELGNEFLALAIVEIFVWMSLGFTQFAVGYILSRRLKEE